MSERALRVPHLLLLGLLATACGDRQVETIEGKPAEPRTQAFSIFVASDLEAKAFDYEQDDIDALELQSEPLLTAEDLLSYCWPEHSFTLSNDADVVFPSPGVYGIPFVVVSRNVRQYVGGLWIPTSSVANHLPTIDLFDVKPDSRSYVIERSFVRSTDGQEPDLRESPTIKDALRTAGKLNKACPPLPRAMKGYELYSWKPLQADWHFALLVGTNRVKTCAEITGPESMNGYKRTAIGVEAAKTLLARLPAGEHVSWNHRSSCDLATPEADIVDDIETYCSSLGLSLAK